VIAIDVISNRFAELAASLDTTLETALNRGVETCIATADPLTPRDTGMLVGNKSITGGGGTRTLTWNQSYAAYQEFGTSRGVSAKLFATQGADAANAVIGEELAGWGR
jgi:hypothetical protein